MKQAAKLRAQAADLTAEANAFEAFGKLQKASCLIFEARQVLDFPSKMDNLEDVLAESKRYVASRLGHKERVDLLVRAGMDREIVEEGIYIDDDVAAWTLATFLFDMAGRYDDVDDTAKIAATTILAQAGEVFPMGYQYWKEGKHDT